RRPALLAERAVEDADAEVRLAAVERIDDEALLARVAERARKIDKQAARRARERLDALRVARGDAAALEQRARLLCERLERLLREPGAPGAEDEIAARWSEIEPSLAEPLRLRYRAARDLLAAMRAPKSEPVRAEPAAAPEPAAAELVPTDPPDAASPTPAAAAPLLAQARFAASLGEADAERRQERERQRALLGELDAAVGALEAALDAGASADAHAAAAHVADLRRRIDATPPRTLAQRLAATEQRYAELARWQHWADQRRRDELCAAIEALPAAGLHPDAVAARVREAQLEWTRLDAGERAGAARNDGLARRFHAACREALAPARGYFKKRQQLREAQTQHVKALIERCATAPGDASTRAEIAALRHEIIEALRGLDRVEPRERKGLAAALKERLRECDARVAALDTAVEQTKAALIAEAEALAAAAPARGAVANARALQQRWQQLGNGRRDRDQAQWRAFRAALDRVFGQLDAARAERDARDAEQRAQAEALCAELEALADAGDRGARQRLESAWAALHVNDPSLRQRFDDALARLREADARRVRAARFARFDGWLARYRLCRAAESAREAPDALRERWAAAAPTDIAETALAARFAAAPGDTPSGGETAHRDVLIGLEMLAGLESPPDDRERRRALQVERLSARLRGGAGASPAQEAAALLERWTVLAAAPEFDERFERAFAAALATLP
ncbi:MAG TPA: DUF349 domain-containing protein, partial [Dokdonella sp.]